jgi:predicted RNA binding protein YcfA (HicA-like mRNA interferase family)
MPLKPLSYRQVKRKLEKAGFQIVSQKSSQVKFAKETSEGILTTIVPYHKEITIGTLSSILRQAKLTVNDFENL